MALRSPTPKVVIRAPIPAKAGIAVSRVTGVQLVSTPGPGQGGVGDDVVEEGQCVVPGHPEDMVGSGLRQTVSQVVGDRVGRRGAEARPVGARSNFVIVVGAPLIFP